MHSFILFPFHFHHAPCPVCESVCEMPVSSGASDGGCAAWLKRNEYYLIMSFFASFFPPFPPIHSVWPSVCLKGTVVCLCASVHAWMCAKCHCHSWVWRFLWTRLPSGPWRNALPRDRWRDWGREQWNNRTDVAEREKNRCIDREARSATLNLFFLSGYCGHISQALKLHSKLFIWKHYLVASNTVFHQNVQ